MTYAETIQYLYARLPMFTRIGAAAYKKDLHNTIALLNALGNPHRQFKSIHIAGTNGKGSTSHMLAAIMQQHGYKTGLYTSPHLVDFRERIKINGDWVSEEFVVAFTQSIQPLIERIEPSFFEVTVAMAFAWFAQQEVDIAIIETGLGGRLDSTNIITPELSVITNIGWDHMNILGDTLDKIAFEKAGIIKPSIPVIIGETTPETEPVFAAKAEECNSPVHLAAQDYSIVAAHPQAFELEVTLKNNDTGLQQTWHTDQGGLYQQHNLRTVMTATHVLHQMGWPLQPTLIQQALQQVKSLTGLHGRWERIHAQPDVVLDVAHNEHGMRQVVNQIVQLHQMRPDMQVHCIIGMVKDKDISKVLALLPAAWKFYFTQAQLPRALPANELQALAMQYHLNGQQFADVNLALQDAMKHSTLQDMILVCGSVFVVGEVNQSALRSAKSGS
jgi:dihydrofolate synthase/folylpolyglutamate synthase